MDYFRYQNGTLHAEDLAIETIAEAVGTPFYLYSAATFLHHYRVFASAFAQSDALICYALKANSNMAILRLLAREGAGADVVSKGELERALRAGIPASKIVFSGVGKTADEMAQALKAGIRQFNVESENELYLLSQTAHNMNLIAPVSLRLNPDVDAKTHAKISTGKAENKFGIAWSKAFDTYVLISKLPNLKAVGIDVHIGSQLTDLAPYRQAYGKILTLADRLCAQGHSIETIDLGGGLGIPYDIKTAAPPDPLAYAGVVQEIFKGKPYQIILEPGRMIAGNAGLLISRLLYKKQGESRLFYIMDAGMNDLIRPSLYDAYHEIIPVRERPPHSPYKSADFVGPVCETGDSFASNRQSVDLEEGELLALRSAGAYGAVMASSYNTRPLVPEILVHGDRYDIIRPRLSIEQLIAQDHIPDWLEKD